MTVNLSFIGGAGWQFFDDSGNPLSGGKIYTYAAGTTTPLTTYTSRDGITPNSNPIILDAAGRTPQQIWSTEGLLYKYVVATSTDVQIRVWDNIGGSLVASNLATDLASTSDNTKGDALVGFKQSNASGFLTNAVARTVNTKLQELVSVKDFGAVGDGVADDTSAFAAAIATGAAIYVPDGTYKLTSTLTGNVNVIFYGSDAETCIITNTASNMFAVNGSVQLSNVTVTSGAYFALVGDNVTSAVNYELRDCIFNNCKKVLDWRIVTSPFPTGPKISTLIVANNKFTNGTGIAFHLATTIDSAIISENSWKDQKTACVWIGVADAAQQAQINNIVITNNTVFGVTSALSTDTAACAFQVQGRRVNISGNVIDSVSTAFGGSGVEVWGIYTKVIGLVVSNNIIMNLSGSTTNTMFVNLKGSTAADTSGSFPYGLDSVVANNVFYNDPAANVFSIGAHLFSDRQTAIGNRMYGVARPFDHIGSENVQFTNIIGNFASAPPAFYNTLAVDYRVSGGTHKLSDNIFSGYQNGIALRTNASNVDLVDSSNNELLCTTGDGFLFYDATSTGSVFTKVRISNGVVTGNLLMRVYNDVIPDIEIDGVDVKGITTDYLFTTDGAYFKNGAIKNLKGLVKTFTDASTKYVLFLNCAANTIVYANFSAAAQSTDSTTYLSKEIRDTWSRIGAAAFARLGTETVVHNATNGGAILAQAASTSIFQLRADGVAAKNMTFRLSYNVLFSLSA